MNKPTLDNFNAFYKHSYHFLKALRHFWSNHPNLTEEQAKEENQKLSKHADQLQKHDVYIWLQEQPTVEAALKKFKHQEYVGIFIIIIGSTFSLYEVLKANPNHLKANTKKDRETVHSQAKKLYASLTATDKLPVALLDLDESKQLSTLLAKLILQIESEADNPISKRQLKKPAERFFIEMLLGHFDSLFKSHMVEIVIELNGLLDEGLSNEAIRTIRNDLFTFSERLNTLREKHP